MSNWKDIDDNLLFHLQLLTLFYAMIVHARNVFHVIAAQPMSDQCPVHFQFVLLLSLLLQDPFHLHVELLLRVLRHFINTVPHQLGKSKQPAENALQDAGGQN